MEKALIFQNSDKEVLVTAEDVKNGIYRRDTEFVDPEYRFKLQFVKGAKNQGKPYFRLYYSYEDYIKLYPDRASRYEIVANMRKYQESQWHKKWKEYFRMYSCEIEKCIHDKNANEWKFADVFYGETKTIIEIQHSYIAYDFEKRNDFYTRLGYKVIWLYDLTNMTVKENGESIDILENNAKGFFRISENPDNLKKSVVFIQVKSGKIYQVDELKRHESDSDIKSSIRYFNPLNIYSEEEFVSAVISGEISSENSKNTHSDIKEGLFRLKDLWKTNYSSIIVEDTERNEVIRINCDDSGQMFRSFDNGCIQYNYVEWYSKYKMYEVKNKKDYSISPKREKLEIWRLLKINKKLN